MSYSKAVLLTGRVCVAVENSEILQIRQQFFDGLRCTTRLVRTFVGVEVNMSYGLHHAEKMTICVNDIDQTSTGWVQPNRPVTIKEIWTSWIQSFNVQTFNCFEVRYTINNIDCYSPMLTC